VNWQDCQGKPATDQEREVLADEAIMRLRPEYPIAAAFQGDSVVIAYRMADPKDPKLPRQPAPPLIEVYDCVIRRKGSVP
jgi:hypothetical protein